MPLIKNSSPLPIEVKRNYLLLINKGKCYFAAGMKHFAVIDPTRLKELAYRGNLNIWLRAFLPALHLLYPFFPHLVDSPQTEIMQISCQPAHFGQNL